MGYMTIKLPFFTDHSGWARVDLCKPVSGPFQQNSGGGISKEELCWF